MCESVVFLTTWLDDIFLILDDFDHSYVKLARLFDAFGKISRLCLNLSKLVIAPLWNCVPSEVKSRLGHLVPSWSAAVVRLNVKLLGIQTRRARTTGDLEICSNWKAV